MPSQVMLPPVTNRPFAVEQVVAALLSFAQVKKRASSGKKCPADSRKQLRHKGREKLIILPRGKKEKLGDTKCVRTKGYYPVLK